MGLLIKCSRGCGEAINVTDDMLAEANKAGKALDVKHEVCPNEPTSTARRFKITTTVVELLPDIKEVCRTCNTEVTFTEGEGWTHTVDVGQDTTLFSHAPDPAASKEQPVTSLGYTVEAPSFQMAIPFLQRALEDQWGKIVGLAPIVDAG
jgi:hypothetical protein